MDVERIIAEIEWLEQLFRLPDNRPLQIAECNVGCEKDTEIIINNPWFRLLRHDNG